MNSAIRGTSKRRLEVGGRTKCNTPPEHGASYLPNRITNPAAGPDNCRYNVKMRQLTRGCH
jgi:hypothetical protein